MKYVIVLGDGMADRAIEKLNGKTPLMAAHTPVLDSLAKKSRIGMVKTIPDGMQPGSDTANLAVLGYDPKIYYTGRSPLEALSIGVPMKETDIAIRCNLVSLTEGEGDYEKQKIIDHSSSEITTKDAEVLLEAVKEQLENDLFHYYLGTSYRHLLIWEQGKKVELTPPHDVLGQEISAYLPEEKLLKEMMKKSYDILKHHPLNEERKKQGLNPANSIWFWGAGTKPILTSFEKKNGKKGAMVSAVDLLKGIAVGAEMKNIEVEGANGTLHTNYEGKAKAATDVLLKEGYDFVYVHVEAPDEMGHQGSIEKKIQAIEFLDGKVIKNIVETLDKSGEAYKILVLPDHPTPISVRTHTADPVPFLMYNSTVHREKTWTYNEETGSQSGDFVTKGDTLIDELWETDN